MTVLTTVSRRGADAGVVTDHPSGEIPERAKRRTFTAAYKLKIVEEYENAEPGARGEVLRREGLYSSHLTEWRKARDVGALAGLAATRGRPPADPVERDNQRLREVNTRLEAELDTARRVIEVQGKVPHRRALLVCRFERGATEFPGRLGVSALPQTDTDGGSRITSRPPLACRSLFLTQVRHGKYGTEVRMLTHPVSVRIHVFRGFWASGAVAQPVRAGDS